MTAPQVKRLMAQGLVTTRQLPGGRVEVDAAELQKIAQAAVKRAVVAAS